MRVNMVGAFPRGKIVVPLDTWLIYVNGRLIIVCFQETVIQYSYGWNVNTFINILIKASAISVSVFLKNHFIGSNVSMMDIIYYIFTIIWLYYYWTE